MPVYKIYLVAEYQLLMDNFGSKVIGLKIA